MDQYILCNGNLLKFNFCMASISDQSQNCGEQIQCLIAHGRLHYGAADLVTIVSTGELNNNSGLSIFHFF